LRGGSGAQNRFGARKLLLTGRRGSSSTSKRIGNGERIAIGQKIDPAQAAAALNRRHKRARAHTFLKCSKKLARNV
jgi:hypothetical protein